VSIGARRRVHVHPDALPTTPRTTRLLPYARHARSSPSLAATARRRDRPTHTRVQPSLRRHHGSTPARAPSPGPILISSPLLTSPRRSSPCTHRTKIVNPSGSNKACDWRPEIRLTTPHYRTEPPNQYPSEVPEKSKKEERESKRKEQTHLSKQWIHFFLSKRWPPTSNMWILRGASVSEHKHMKRREGR
jgi:hypothetical protein